MSFLTGGLLPSFTLAHVFHVCLYVLDISKTAAVTQTVPGIRDLAVKIILQKLFCFADKFSKLLTLQFNSCFCTIEPFTIGYLGKGLRQIIYVRG